MAISAPQNNAIDTGLPTTPEQVDDLKAFNEFMLVYRAIKNVAAAATAATAATAAKFLPLSSMSSSLVTTTIAQAIAVGVETLVQFNTVGFDDLAEFNTATSLWTVKAGGTYLIGASVYGSQLTVTSRNVALLVNGGLREYLSATNNSNGQSSTSNNTIQKLNAGNTVGIYYYSGLTDTINTTSALTYATLERIK
jgi:hypothetical protein